jgi:predicted outer membrane repeat protein
MEKYLPKRSRVFRWAAGGLFLLLATLPWMASLQAAGVVGTGTAGSCTQAALTTALAGGGTVTFNCGGAATILVISQITITQATVIEGGGLITITGPLNTSGQTTRLFDVTGSLTSLTLNDIVLENFNSAGSGGGNGGAIRSVGTLALNNVTIQFSLSGCGGAIYSDGTLIVSNSTFGNNTGFLAGGAICTGVPVTNRLQVTNSSFTNNKVTDVVLGSGGAIYVSGPIAEATIIDSLFLDNSAKFGGGLSVWTGGTATLSTQNPGRPNTFIGNSATQDGGAIYNLGTLAIFGAGLNANSAPQNTIGIGHGGAIANSGNLTLHDSVVTVNKGRFGGGLFVGIIPSAVADIRRTIFSQNEASEFGGGLCTGDASFNTGATVTVTDSVFRNNTAVVSGGGVYRFNARLDISNSSFTDNGSLGTGGGLYSGANVPDPTAVNATSVTFGGNAAGSGQGGGIYTTGYSVLKNLTLKDNINGLFNAGNFVTTHLGNSVLDNLGNPGFLNCDGSGKPILLDGHNLSTDNSCAVEQNVVTAHLGPRVINTNGINQTRYYPPQAGSPLINAAANCPTLDQRGAARPDVCDIGAVEFGGLAWNTYLPLIKR